VDPSDNGESLANGDQLGCDRGTARLQNHALIDHIDIRVGIDGHCHGKRLCPLVFEVAGLPVGLSERSNQEQF
jgi:hypothetical protein